MKLQGQLVLVGANHHTALVAQREKLSLDASRTAEFYTGIKSLPWVRESFVLNTCNRLEVYANIEQVDAIEPIKEFLCNFNRLDRPEFESIQFQRLDLEAITHLFEVASGVDSQIVGEAEILGQVKEAYTVATRLGSIGPVLNRLIQKSFQAAKWIRTHTAIGEGQINTATVAVDLTIKIFGRLDQNRILIIGGGEIGEKTARALHSRGARALTVTSQTVNTAAVLATRIGAESVPIEVIDRDLGTFDIVVSSTSSPTQVISRNQVEEAMKRRSFRPFFLIDLAVPRDIDPGSGDLVNVYLYNIDDLSVIATENLAHRKAEVARCRAVLLERAGVVWTSIEPGPNAELKSPSGFRAGPSG